MPTGLGILGHNRGQYSIVQDDSVKFRSLPDKAKQLACLYTYIFLLIFFQLLEFINRFGSFFCTMPALSGAPGYLMCGGDVYGLISHPHAHTTHTQLITNEAVVSEYQYDAIAR